MNFFHRIFNTQNIAPEFSIEVPTHPLLVENLEKKMERTAIVLQTIEESLEALHVQVGVLGQGGKKEGSEITKEEAISLGSHLFTVEESSNLLLEQNLPGHAASYLRTVKKQLEKINGLMKKKGVEYVNHTGQKFSPGMKVEVLDWESTPDIEAPKISETIEPSIFYKGKLVRPGKVIGLRKEE